jgi:hypothetical protein
VGPKNGTNRKSVVHCPQRARAAGPYGLIRTVLIGLRSRFYEQKRDLMTLVSPPRFMRGMKQLHERIAAIEGYLLMLKKLGPRS